MQIRMTRRTLAIALLAVYLLLAGCSPEASRTRGGGPGADVGNRTLGPAVEVHGQTNPLYATPAVGRAPQESR